MRNKTKRTYWYKYHYDECPPCGSYALSCKERVYNERKPEDWHKRHVIHQYMCYSCAMGY